jgi:CheY-like chemotaxis protein
MAKVLVVDDEELVCSLLVDMLEAEGHQVRTAGDGRQALAAMRQEVPDLLITDLIMPEKEGLELITTLRQRGIGMKILAISGGSRFVDPVDQLKAARLLGADLCMAKPIEYPEFLAVVSRLLAEAYD